MASGQFAVNATIPAGAIGDTQISNQTSDIINYVKLQPWQHKGTTFGTVIGGTPSAAEYVVLVADGPGTILGFHAKLNAAGVSTAVTVDIKKNGSSISTSTISIGNSTAKADGTVSSASFTTGDVISLALAGTMTGAQGPYAWVSYTMTAAPTT